MTVEEKSVLVRYSRAYRVVAVCVGILMIAAMGVTGVTWRLTILTLLFLVPAVLQVLFFRLEAKSDGFEYRNAWGKRYWFEYSEIHTIVDVEDGGFWIYSNRTPRNILEPVMYRTPLPRMLAVVSLVPHPIDVPGNLKSAAQFRDRLLGTSDE